MCLPFSRISGFLRPLTPDRTPQDRALDPRAPSLYPLLFPPLAHPHDTFLPLCVCDFSSLSVLSHAVPPFWDPLPTIFRPFQLPCSTVFANGSVSLRPYPLCCAILLVDVSRLPALHPLSRYVSTPQGHIIQHFLSPLSTRTPHVSFLLGTGCLLTYAAPFSCYGPLHQLLLPSSAPTANFLFNSSTFAPSRLHPGRAYCWFSLSLTSFQLGVFPSPIVGRPTAPRSDAFTSGPCPGVSHSILTSSPPQSRSLYLGHFLAPFLVLILPSLFFLPCGTRFYLLWTPLPSHLLTPTSSYSLGLLYHRFCSPSALFPSFCTPCGIGCPTSPHTAHSATLVTAPQDHVLFRTHNATNLLSCSIPVLSPSVQAMEPAHLIHPWQVAGTLAALLMLANSHVLFAARFVPVCTLSPPFRTGPPTLFTSGMVFLRILFSAHLLAPDLLRPPCPVLSVRGRARFCPLSPPFFHCPFPLPQHTELLPPSTRSWLFPSPAPGGPARYGIPSLPIF